MKRVLSTICRVISYILYFIAIGGGILNILSGNFHLIYSSIALAFFLLIGFLFKKLARNLYGKQIKEQNLNDKNSDMKSPNLSPTKTKDSDTHNSISRDAHLGKRNVLLTLGITFVFLVDIICFPGSNLEEWLWFYAPLFFSIWIYYLYLIWKIKSYKIEDFLFIRLLRRFHLMVKDNNLYAQRSLLLKTSFIPLLLTLILPILAFLLNGVIYYDDDERMIEDFVHSLLLIIPIIGWFAALAYAWSKAWLQTKNE